MYEALAFWCVPEAGALLYVGHWRRNGTSDYSDAKFRLVWSAAADAPRLHKVLPART